MIVPRKGAIITRPQPEYRFMHGSPWDYDADIPLLFYGAPYVRRGVYSEAANHQDIAPTLAAVLRVGLPPTVTGRALRRHLNLSAGPPRVIFLAVLDGMRRDYFDRYASDLPTLTRLRKQGAWFSRARVNYLPSTTALGHSTIGTGADPRVHGIILNSPFNRIQGRQEDPFPDMSLRNLMALTLGDIWNLKTDGQAAIIVQGSIFYAAAGLGGHGACILNGRPIILASYDARSGDWQTNPECYRLPEYLKNHNSRTVWEAVNGTWLGHAVSSPDSVRRSALFARFEADALVELIEHEPVGADELTDLVLVNLKTPDFVGHQYGPDSPEIRETLAELDRQLARVLKTLETKVGAGHYLIVLTADHGMPQEPAYGQERIFGPDITERVHTNFDPGRRLVAHYDPANSQVFVDKIRLQELKLRLSDIKEYLESLPFILAAYTEDEVQNATLP